MNAAASAGPRTPGVPFVLANFAAFQVGWFACVLGAAHGVPWAGTGTAAAIVAVHIARVPRPTAELKLAAIAVLIGAAWDSTLVAAGWLGFTSGTVIERAAPHWILALWALLAITLNVSMRWLRGRPIVAALLGAVAGPLSYWAGVRMGAVHFLQPAAAVTALAVGWAVMMPSLVAIAARCDGVASAEPA